MTSYDEQCDDEREEGDEYVTLAAHAYRDQKIFCTVLIALHPDGLYHLGREGRPEEEDDLATTLGEALMKADTYLAGYMAGYDEGIAHATKNP